MTEMRRFLLGTLTCLVLLGIVGIAGAAYPPETLYGDPEYVLSGKLEIRTLAALDNATSSSRFEPQWLDADQDGNLDAGDGFYIKLGSTTYGPYLASGGAAPTDAEYWVGAANGTLSAEHNLGAITGIVYSNAGTPAAVTIGTTGIDLNTTTLDFDPTEVGSVTWGTGTTWTFPTSIQYTTPFAVIGNGTTNGGVWRFLEDADNGTNYTAVAAAASIASNATLTLPLVDITMPTALPAATYLMQLSSAGAMTTVGSVFTDNHIVRADGVGNIQDGGWTIADSSSNMTGPTDAKVIIPGASSRNIQLDPVGGNGQIELTQSSAAARSLSTLVNGDGSNRFDLFASGEMQWGPGSAGADTILQRQGANKLGVSVGDSFRAGDFVELAEQGSAPSASSGFIQVYGDKGSTEHLRYINDDSEVHELGNIDQSFAMCMPGFTRDPAGAGTNFTTGSCYAHYILTAPTSVTTIVVNTALRTAANTITWAEVAIAKADSWTFGSAPTLTTVGYADVSATFNSTGNKTTSITCSGILPGDKLFIVFGSSAVVPYQPYAGLASQCQTGVFSSRAVQPSTLSGQVMTIAGTSDPPAECYLSAAW